VPEDFYIYQGLGLGLGEIVQEGTKTGWCKLGPTLAKWSVEDDASPWEGTWKPTHFLFLNAHFQ
jgi:hypothetical protein